jgi:hypothetical protein
VKKPHEQEWTYEPAREGFFGHHQHVATEGALIPPPVASVEDGESLLRFIAAAPAMARELVKATARCPVGCECGMCAALRKGGVIS